LRTVHFYTVCGILWIRAGTRSKAGPGQCGQVSGCSVNQALASSSEDRIPASASLLAVSMYISIPVGRYHWIYGFSGIISVDAEPGSSGRAVELIALAVPGYLLKTPPPRTASRGLTPFGKSGASAVWTGRLGTRGPGWAGKRLSTYFRIRCAGGNGECIRPLPRG
jgi:hypothetical protein